MREAVLVLTVSILAGGCSLFGLDCESSTPDYTQQQPGLRLDTPPVPTTDTLTVAVFFGGRAFELDVGDRVEAPETYEGSGLRIAYTSSGDALPSPLRSVVRNDTVFVGTEDAFSLYRRACQPSYAGARLNIDRVQAPEGVRVIRWTFADPYTAPRLPAEPGFTV